MDLKSKLKQLRQIKDIAEFNSENIGKNFQYAEIEYIDTSSVTEGRLTTIQKLERKKSPSRAKRLVKNNDIVISTVRPNLKHYYFVKNAQKNLVVSTGFVVIRPIEVDPLYLYYYLITPMFIEYLVGVAESHTSAYPSFPPEIIENAEIDLPDENIQKKIGKILYDLDSQIENLQKQNKILEQIIQSIFKSWFIDFDGVTEFEDSELGKIPKGWQIGILENFLDLTKGVSYKSQDLKFSNKALVTLKSVKRGGGYTNIGLKSFDGKYNENQVVKENDIIVAQTDLTQNADVIGKPALIRDSKHFDILVASLDIVIIKIKNNKILKFYIYYLFLTDRFQNHVYGYTSGTTVLHLAKDAIPNFVFILPPTKTLEKFDKLISTWIQKNHENNNQIENLTKIRDFLLPKLMSGEIRV